MITTGGTPGVADIFGVLAAAVVPAVLPMLPDMAAGGNRRRRHSDSEVDAERFPLLKRRRVDAVPCELGELEPCFAAFEREAGIALEPYIVDFARLSFIPIERLQEVTDHKLAKGVLHKLRAFCNKWYSNLSLDNEEVRLLRVP